ncbi:MAG: NAD-dependent epimerase/dehydratase family protein, partial [Planctomycetota bacterium]
FIGSYLVEQLVEEGARTVIVDNLETGRLANMAAVQGKVEFHEADVTNLGLCRELLQGADAVMNLAAQAPGVGHSHRHHVELLGRNLQIASAVLEAARQAEVPRVLVVSSSCVYPDDAPVPTPELAAFTAEPERVNSGYGWAKRYAELQGLHYAERFGMEVAIARPFNAYGTRDLASGARSHVIPALIERLLSDSKELLVWGSGEQTRSFIHARDVAAGLRLLSERHALADPVNVGHDKETSIRELVALLMELAEVEKKVVFDRTKPEGCRRKAADMTKFRQVTGGYEPETSLQAGLKEMIEAHRARSFMAEGEIDRFAQMRG